MTGNIAQLIALASFGNQFIKSGKLPADFYPKNSTFQYCKSVDYLTFRKSRFIIGPRESLIAKNPYEWFNLLEYEECKGFKLHFEHSKDQSFAPDYKLAGLVGGGGIWLLEAIYQNHSNYWASKWEVINADAPDRKIWGVKYALISKRRQKSDLQFDVAKTKIELDSILSEVREFANGNNMEYWASLFEKAQATLISPAPSQDYYHKYLIEINDYPLEAQQLIFSAGMAWVFGAMGSWNDFGFEDKERQKAYEDISAKLYDTIIKAILSAINANIENT